LQGPVVSTPPAPLFITRLSARLRSQPWQSRQTLDHIADVLAVRGPGGKTCPIFDPGELAELGLTQLIGVRLLE
jgi:hypothetical protein